VGSSAGLIHCSSTNALTILGNYKQAAKGRLIIPIYGTNSTDFGQLIVTNAATLDGNVTFKFINGFAPKAGDHFDFLNVGGPQSGAFASVGLQNLAPGFQFNILTNSQLLGMTALNDAQFSTALPGQVDVTVTNLGGITYAICTATTSNTCDSITLEGPLTRTNNTFNQTFQGTTFIRSDCGASITTVTNLLVLGALSPGDYLFGITASGETVKSVSFSVPPVAGKTFLGPRQLADGSVQFEIEGPASVRYTIEASTDLKTWIRLGAGSLPGTFNDPDAAVFSRRFYRAVIGP